ncbi:uncharacterized protein EV420DRAFT_1476146 [Desarmillaria tabescens]|uniref:Uncharacterized protein n=1 Tax=Armillaria tabescens TaxID=1929756 RepID=A0AA39NFL4_ARMTA|nr:uncharacterized protein EV420DRAFT_1476146 [Desarmillaria tabescens]KAK0464755.1 hypothetical protein EV420DRAFT_1476146 [Desarmillaria tabescens]
MATLAVWGLVWEDLSHTCMVSLVPAHNESHPWFCFSELEAHRDQTSGDKVSLLKAKGYIKWHLNGCECLMKIKVIGDRFTHEHKHWSLVIIEILRLDVEEMPGLSHPDGELDWGNIMSCCQFKTGQGFSYEEGIVADNVFLESHNNPGESFGIEGDEVSNYTRGDGKTLVPQQVESHDSAFVWEVETFEEFCEENVGTQVFRVEFGSSAIGDCCDEGVRGGHDVASEVFWETCSEVVPGYVYLGEGGIGEGGGRSCQEDRGFFTGAGEFVVEESLFSHGQFMQSTSSTESYSGGFALVAKYYIKNESMAVQNGLRNDVSKSQFYQPSTCQAKPHLNKTITVKSQGLICMEYKNQEVEEWNELDASLPQ